MVFVMNSDYSYLDRLQIEETMYNIIEKAFHEKYGKQPDEELVCRVQNEWLAIERTDTLFDVAVLYELSRWLRENHYPYRMSGLSGSSFILYLLGITSGNPLPPHTYCPCCKKVRFEKGYHDGFDIPESLCADDNTPVIRDGHNIPWQSLWGYSYFFTMFEMKLPAEIYDLLVEKLEKHLIIKFPYENELSFKPSELNEDINTITLSDVYMEFSLNIDSVSPDFYNRKVSAGDKKYILDNWIEELNMRENEVYESIPEILFPKSIADIISLLGLLHSHGVWDNVITVLTDNTNYSISDILSVREDVFFYLINHGFIEKDAFHGMSRVRKGTGLPVVTEEMRNAADKWAIDFCMHTKFLWCRADIVEYLIFWVKGMKQIESS